MARSPIEGMFGSNIGEPEEAALPVEEVVEVVVPPEEEVVYDVIDPENIREIISEEEYVEPVEVPVG